MGVKGLRFFLSCKVMHKLSSTSYENSYSTNLSLLSIPCGMNICNSFILWIGDIWSCARTIYLQLKMMKNRLNFYNFFCLIFYHLKWGEPASLFLTQWLVIEPMPRTNCCNFQFKQQNIHKKRMQDFKHFQFDNLERGEQDNQ